TPHKPPNIASGWGTPNEKTKASSPPPRHHIGQRYDRGIAAICESKAIRSYFAGPVRHGLRNLAPTWSDSRSDGLRKLLVPSSHSRHLVAALVEQRGGAEPIVICQADCGDWAERAV